MHGVKRRKQEKLVESLVTPESIQYSKANPNNIKQDLAHTFYQLCHGTSKGRSSKLQYVGHCNHIYIHPCSTWFDFVHAIAFETPCEFTIELVTEEEEEEEEEDGERTHEITDDDLEDEINQVFNQSDLEDNDNNYVKDAKEYKKEQDLQEFLEKEIQQLHQYQEKELFHRLEAKQPDYEDNAIGITKLKQLMIDFFDSQGRIFVTQTKKPNYPDDRHEISMVIYSLNFEI